MQEKVRNHLSFHMDMNILTHGDFCRPGQIPFHCIGVFGCTVLLLHLIRHLKPDADAQTKVCA